MIENLSYPTELLFLGTGTSTGIPEIGCSCQVCESSNPKDKRSRSSVLLRSAEQTILIDCGPDFRQQMLTHKINKIDAILVTHEHYDHLAGLDDVRLLGEMNVYAQGRVLKVIEKNMPYAFFENRMNLLLPNIKLHEVFSESFFIGKWKIQPIKLNHMKLPILGFRINNMAYLTDFNEIPDTEFEKLQALDVLVIDALRIKPHPSHNNLVQALDFVEKLKPQKAYFTHMSHGMGLHDEIQKILPDSVFLAYDGLSVSL